MAGSLLLLIIGGGLLLLVVAAVAALIDNRLNYGRWRPTKREPGNTDEGAGP